MVITGQQGIEVSRPADAVRVVEQVRDETGLRASTMPRGFGNVVKYPEGQVVGHVSYNGRFWTPRTPLPLHQPTIMPPADVWEEESPPPPAFRAGRPVAVGRDDEEHAYIKALEKAAKATKNPLLRDLYTREIHRGRAEHTPPTVGAPVAVWRRVTGRTGKRTSETTTGQSVALSEIQAFGIGDLLFIYGDTEGAAVIQTAVRPAITDPEEMTYATRRSLQIQSPDHAADMVGVLTDYVSGIGDMLDAGEGRARKDSPETRKHVREELRSMQALLDRLNKVAMPALRARHEAELAANRARFPNPRFR